MHHQLLPVGAVFTFPVERTRSFAACQILSVGKDSGSVLGAVLDWVSQAPPTLE